MKKKSRDVVLRVLMTELSRERSIDEFIDILIRLRSLRRIIVVMKTEILEE